MEKIQNQKHTKETFYYSISRMLERASYYGLRALAILYMTGEILNMDSTKALNIYGWFTGSVLISILIGALLGDLVFGNRKTIIIGGLLQAFGAFTLCFPSETGLYIGLFLIGLGSGFYTPNIISNFGKSYLNKTKLLDSGFTIFYFAINLGSFLGIFLLGYLGEKYGYKIGFAIGGILMLISLVPIIKLKDKFEKETFTNELSISNRILKISITLLAIGLFWGIYEISNIRILDLQLEFGGISSLNISKSVWQSINSILVLPLSLIAIILWTYFYNSQFFKLILGFIFGVISFLILLTIPDVPTEKHTIIYLIAILFLGISEIHISPIVHSILTKYSNPKYLAILIGLSLIIAKLFIAFFGLFNDRFFENPVLGLKFGIITLTIVCSGLIGYVVLNKKTTYNNV